MDIFFDRPHGPQTIILKNKNTTKSFSIVYDSRVYEIPPETLFRIPADHYQCVAQQPEFADYITMIDPGQGTTEYLESEKKRLTAELERKKAEMAQAQADMAQAEEDLRVASTKLNLPPGDTRSYPSGDTRGYPPSKLAQAQAQAEEDIRSSNPKSSKR